MGVTTASLIEGFKAEHEHLDEGLARLTDVLDRMRAGVDGELLTALRDTDRFLNRVFLPHAEWEELTFYPVVGELIRRHGDVNAGMMIDHRVILNRIDQFVVLIRRIDAGERTPELLDQARILGYQIRALVEAHDRKEEEVYCGLLRRHLSDQEAVRAFVVGDLTGHD
jgi:hemerythrin-like domain-containing protein